jgi:hypothetical protein
MKTAYIALAAAGVLALGVSACNKDRSAEADTGTAKAVVTTEAPASTVPDSQLQQQAQQAATASSTPVDGSGPIKNETPPVPPASSAPIPAKK